VVAFWSARGTGLHVKAMALILDKEEDDGVEGRDLAGEMLYIHSPERERRTWRRLVVSFGTP
jgi:hypothetical protein